MATAQLDLRGIQALMIAHGLYLTCSYPYAHMCCMRSARVTYMSSARYKLASL